mgnify:CR=1 FL=1|tara:strand:+ start:1027 stop:2121 length:1095 start_codon:yes stop_codon:yes gene_type:complete
MKKVITVIFVNLSVIFAFDFFFGQKTLNFFYDKGIIQSQESIRIKAIELQKKEKSYRIKHDYFHHTLKPNIKVDSKWGNLIYKTCTDEFGFRTSCQESEKKSNKNIIIIGDSTIEGLGLNYDKIFPGMLKKSYKKNIINMGVTSYSPIIYFKKIQYYIDNGLDVDEVFVFIDISDIDDESIYYECEKKKSVCTKSLDKLANINKFNEVEKKFFPLFDQVKLIIKQIKRKIKPKVYIYRKDYHRSYWTYSENNNQINKGIKNATANMSKLYEYLSKKNIPISVGVYPIPGQILHDVETSKQVEIWRNFCIKKCKNFINLFPIFFEEKSKLSDMDIVKKYYLKHDVHFNELGHEKIFKELLRLNVF